MLKNNQIELLSPAKNLECAIAAVNAGADALYIGAAHFGARSSAGNTIQDIEDVIKYARKYYVRVYAAVNTILTNQEIPQAVQLINFLYEAGIDAVIIQDMGLLEQKLPPVPLFASTQTNNADVDKVLFLEKAGFSRVILARELTLEEIRYIRSKTTVELEAFVHGALCVSYSGLCTMSYSIGGRSGNRGECAQPCRMTYDLVDRFNKTIVKSRHLLSLKDLNLSSHLEEMINAGITSFKIEGRLKDIDYVKNVVSYYRKELDKILCGNYKKSSSGKVFLPFEPDPKKSFNRGFTDYFLHGRHRNIASFDTQKSVGERIGCVEKIEQDYFLLDKQHNLLAGDGICFLDQKKVLSGMFIQKVENNKVYPQDIRYIFPGAEIYRNHDLGFERILKSARMERKVGVKIRFTEKLEGFRIEAEDEDGNSNIQNFDFKAEPARDEDKAKETIQKQLSKTGDSVFYPESVDIKLESIPFIPVSQLNEWRRTVLEQLEMIRIKKFPKIVDKIHLTEHLYPLKEIDYTSNVLNSSAQAFYKRHGVGSIEPAAESGLIMSGKTVMTTKLCIRYELGYCLKTPKGAELSGPLYISDKKNRFKLEFDCDNCCMLVLND